MSLVAMLLRSRGGRVLVLCWVVGWLGWMAWGDAVAGYNQRLAELAHHGAKPDQHGRAGVPAPPPCRASRADIPCGYLALYQAAARTCPGLSWPLLAGIGKVESDHGRNAATSSAGAEGPMQFLPGTWAVYGRGGNVRDPRAAIPAAARLLCANGLGDKAAAHDPCPGLRGTAPVHEAVFAYNHACWYVGQVLAAAGSYQGGGR